MRDSGWGGGPSGKLSSLRGGSGVFVHRKCCSASSLPHINYDRGGGAEKNICEPYGNPWRLHSTARLASLVDVCLLFIPFCAFPLLPPPPPTPTEPGPNLCKSLTMSNISVSFFLPFFLSFFLYFFYR